MQSFAFNPLIALLMFVLEFCTLVAAKKSPLVRIYLVMLFFLIMWSGGSALMRLQFLGLINPWFHISLVGIWVACVALDILLARFADKKISLFEKCLCVLILGIMIANVITGKFLAPPTLVTLASGQSVFVYQNFTVGTYFMYAVYAVFSVLILARVAGCVKSHVLTSAQALPISIGSVCIIAGQAFILLPPFRGIPVDMITGIIFAVTCFVSLYNKHLFSLTLMFSDKTYAILTVGLMLIVCTQLVAPLNWFISTLPEPLGSNSVLVVTLIAVAGAFLMLWFVEFLSNKIFLKGHASRSEGLRVYQEDISKVLNVTEISERYCQQVCHDLKSVGIVRLCLRNDEGGMSIAGSSIPFEAGGTIFKPNSSVVEWLTKHHDVLTLTEFMRSHEARYMWEEERRQLQLLDMYCILPLMSNDELEGISIITLKDSRASLSVSEMDNLMLIGGVTAISIKNSMLYEHASYEARTDFLTGLLNRKYFHEELERIHKANPQAVKSLVLINIDDFKLYNQLYGEAESDLALQRVASVIQTTAGESYLTARLGGKEFAVLMPSQGANDAKRFAENVQSQIFHLNHNDDGQALKVLTCSIGICSMPFDAHTTKQMLDNANMAVYHVKQHGKNGLMVYSTGLIDSNSEQEPTDYSNIYSSYAGTIYALTAAIDAKDHYTFTHSNNVAHYAAQLAQAYGLNSETVELLHEAGLLHDVGKIGIPESILNKPDKLSADEYEIIKKHPQNAVAIIRHLPSLDYVIPAVVGHHERWDGKGYPRRLAGEDIPLTARILCIADCFDAITTVRCYQDSKALDRALGILEDGAGTQFDPILAELFVNEVRAGRIELQKTFQEA